MIKYWEIKGSKGDIWLTCDSPNRWFEHNCTMQPGIEMAIWEPCNYVSNLAYDRLVVELCSQTDWVMELNTLNDIRLSGPQSSPLIGGNSARYWALIGWKNMPYRHS